MRGHHGHHRRRWGKQGRARWVIARGLHRRMVSFLLSALLLGVVAGWMLHTVSHLRLMGGVLLVTLFLFWPLSWIATFRIVRPIRDLARVAGAIRGGELGRRADLPDGDDEVGEVAIALRDMAARVEGQLADQRALMAAVSHELRSPLGRVRVLVELARDGMGPADVHDRLQSEIDGMDALVGDLLAGSRIDFDAIQPKRLRAGDVARSALKTARQPSTLLTLDYDGDLRADPTLLSRAVSGLLENAVRHAGAPVGLRVFEVDDDVCFEVTDDGPGFSEGEELQVFQPFWRRPPRPGEAPEPGGVGLGLALVRRIAAAHGGAAGASNRASGGARVWISVPRREDSAASVAWD